jgi:succinate dehydrogenase/fumarate reductase flavoprotein subunit
MGKRAAVGAAKFAAEHTQPVEIDASQVQAELTRLERYLTPAVADPVTPAAALAELQKLMWANVGIKRTAGPLAEALNALRHMKQHFSDHVRAAKTELAFNRQWIACLELENMIDTAQTVVYAALLREDSRGAHFRDDFPTLVPVWDRRNIVVQLHPEQPAVDLLRYEIVDQSQL